MPGSCPSYLRKMWLVSGQLDDHDCNKKKINTVFPTILKVEFCLGIDKKKTKDVEFLPAAGMVILRVEFDLFCFVLFLGTFVSWKTSPLQELPPL